MSIYTTFPLPPFKEMSVIYSYDVTKAIFPLTLQELGFENQDRWCLCHKEQQSRIYVSIQIYKNHTLKVRGAFWSC